MHAGLCGVLEVSTFLPPVASHAKVVVVEPTPAVALRGVFAKQPPRPSGDAHRQPAADQHAQRGADALGAAQPRAHRAKQQQGCGGRDLREGGAASAQTVITL